MDAIIQQVQLKRHRHIFNRCCVRNTIDVICFRELQPSVALINLLRYTRQGNSVTDTTARLVIPLTSLLRYPFNPFRSRSFFLKITKQFSVTVKRWSPRIAIPVSVPISFPVSPFSFSHLFFSPTSLSRILLFAANSISTRDDFSPEGTNLTPTCNVRTIVSNFHVHRQSGCSSRQKWKDETLFVPTEISRCEISMLNLNFTYERTNERTNEYLIRSINLYILYLKH